MRFERLDLNLLVALDALLANRNVSAAAEQLNMSQSAMSSALGRLREFFGDALLTPAGRRMIITARGEELAEPIRLVLSKIRSTITNRPEFNPAESTRRVRIIASDYAFLVMIADALREIARVAPLMRFECRNIDEPPLDLLLQREVDLIITLPHAQSNSLPRVPFFDDEYVVIAWTGNKVAARGIDEQLYFRLGHVSTEFGRAKEPAFEEHLLKAKKLRRRIEIVAPSFVLVPHLVVGTDRIATVHRRHAERAARYLPLAIFPAPFPLPRVEQFVQWHTLSDEEPAIGWVVAQLQDFACTAAASERPQMVEVRR